jgi:hypothetical protein
MALVTDIIPPAELAGFVRELDPAAYGFTLMADYLPMRDVESNEYEFTRSDGVRVQAGSYRAWDVEAPIASRQGFSKVRGEIPPASIKMPLGEEQRLFLARLNGNDAPLVNALFDDAATLTEALLARFEVAIGEALFAGEVTFNMDAGYLSTLKVDYGATTTVSAPGVLWSTIASSTPITDLELMCTEYATANGGRRPARILTSTKVRSLMLQSAQVKSFAAYNGMTPQIVRVDQLGDILSAYNLPPVEVYDTQVNIAGSATRVTPLNDLALLPETNQATFGETQNGLTAEALELQGSGFLPAGTAPGLTGVIDKVFDPAGHWTKVTGIRLPVIKDPKKIAKATVSA